MLVIVFVLASRYCLCRRCCLWLYSLLLVCIVVDASWEQMSDEWHRSIHKWYMFVSLLGSVSRCLELCGYTYTYTYTDTFADTYTDTYIDI